MKIVLCFICIIYSQLCLAKRLQVITTTTNLKSLVEEIGGDSVHVESITKGSQDPHYVEAKPSYMLKLAKADLLISLGLGLESGWLPLVIRGARRSELRQKSQRHMIASDYIDLIEVRDAQSISRADGDIHPQGNPHFLLDPTHSITLAKIILQRLSQLAPTDAQNFNSRYQVFVKKMKVLIQELKNKIPVGIKVISYHRTLSYFFQEFQINLIDVLEPKPGIPPSAKHIISTIKKIKQQKIKVVLIENYFDDSVAHKLESEIKGLKVTTIPVAVNGSKKVTDLFKLYQSLAKAIYE